MTDISLVCTGCHIAEAKRAHESTKAKGVYSSQLSIYTMVF